MLLYLDYYITLGHLLLILCFRSEKFPLTMQAGGSLFIIHYYNYTFNDQKLL